jgi:hypothetical protein
MRRGGSVKKITKGEGIFNHKGHRGFFTEGTKAFAWKRVLRDLPFKGHRGTPAAWARK